MKRIITILSCILLCAILLPSCGSGIVQTATGETKTAAPAETQKTAETAPAPVTTEEEKPDDPADDGILNILMIGSSFCYYYVDELYGMLKAVGIESEVWNLYYSGATVKMHWDWYLENSAVCTLYRTSKNGRQEYKDASLKGSLARRNWDIISIQGAGGMKPTGETAEELAKKGMENGAVYAEKLAKMLRKAYPLAALYWHQTWAYQVGYDRNGIKVPDKATQQTMYEAVRSVSHQISENLDLILVPSGDAWQNARNDPAVGDVLCNRIKDGGDNYHDGDIGGGQYLNAATWFEVITGQSIIGNTYRPSYSLSETKIAGLQKAAHAAVEALKA